MSGVHNLLATEVPEVYRDYFDFFGSVGSVGDGPGVDINAMGLGFVLIEFLPGQPLG